MASTVPMEIAELRVYPIKSCRGIKVDGTRLTRQGLHLDRLWMFVSAKTHEFLTIRQKSQMTLINTSISSDGETLTISIHDVQHDPIAIPVHPSDEYLKANTESVSVDIWENLTSAYAYTDKPMLRTFEDFFGEPVKLVMKSPEKARVCGGNGDPKLLGREATTNFPDVLPILIGSEASLSELNSRLQEPARKNKLHADITIERFRPNIIIRAAQGHTIEPWSEDRWTTVRINGSGSNSLISNLTRANKDALDVDVVARCARCQVPNVDPDTAEKNPKQPWDTLVSYRRVDPGIKWKPCFGMLACPRDEGEVKVGMRFEVLEVMKEGEEHVYSVGF